MGHSRITRKQWPVAEAVKHILRTQNRLVAVREELRSLIVVLDTALDPLIERVEGEPKK